MNWRQVVSVWLVYGGVWILGMLGLFAYSKLSASDFPASVTRTDDDSRRAMTHHAGVEFSAPGNRRGGDRGNDHIP